MQSCVLSEPVYSFILQRLCYLGKRSLCFLAYFYFTIFFYVLIFELLEGTRTWFFIHLIYLHVWCVFIFRQFFKPQHFFIAKFIFWEKNSKGQKKSPRKIFDTLNLFLRVRFPFFSEPYFSEDFTTHTWTEFHKCECNPCHQIVQFLPCPAFSHTLFSALSL